MVLVMLILIRATMKVLNEIYKLQSLEDSFRSSVRPLILLCQMFGVAPLPVSFSQTEKVDGFRWRICGRIHQFWCAGIIIAIVTSFYFQHVKFNTIIQYSQIKVLLHIGQYACIIGTCSACVIGSQIQSSSYNKYFQNIIKIDLKLTKWGSRINFVNLKKFIRRCIVLCFSFEVVMVSVFAMSFLGEDNSIVRNIALYIIPHIMVLLTVIKYTSLLYAIQERYQNVNVLLKKVSFDLLFKKEYRQKHTPTTENKICQRINGMRLVFLDISKFSADVNGSFGVLVIFILVSTFLILSTEFFAFYEYIEQSAPDFYVPVLSLLWIIFYGGRIIFVLRMNHAVNIEKCKLGCILYEINFYGFGLENSVESCLNTFSMQLLHEDRCEKACGMVELNLPLLKTIFGAITTYLVILIQFHSSNN
ncbi:Gustatory receptor for sugar taste 43a [Pseudolycoriella hygida]|uniref:Gustatory receptor n=1 Tax=Pseudolycoriella hygida TaxID=35572 RepID=A0A9Q0MRP9_9DIPT|nr:Gustatory receptor for sugar taste 43a [Pseudolycoriella hygida]